MASEESKRIRDGFAQNIKVIGTPLEVERQQWEEVALQIPLPPNVSYEAVLVGDVDCEWVKAADHDTNSLIIYLHGGGFNSGSSRTHRELAARVSVATGVSVLLINYRLAPEAPFPAAVEDVAKVYQWFLKSPLDLKRIIFAGDSAGGGLALQTLLALRDQGTPMPRALVLISTWADLSLSGDSITTRADADPVTTQEELAEAATMYIAERDARDPMISPVYADFQGLPPMLIHVGNDEILLDDSKRIADQARAAGVEFTLTIWTDMWHVFHAWGQMPEAQQAIDAIGAYVREKLDLRNNQQP